MPGFCILFFAHDHRYGHGTEIAGFLVVDEFNVTDELNMTWGLHTHAAVTAASTVVLKGLNESGVDAVAPRMSLGDQVLLSQNGSSITVMVLQHATPEPVAFTAVPVLFAPPLLPDPGVVRLQLLYSGGKLRTNATTTNAMTTNATTRLVVAITSGGDARGSGALPPAARPLSEWASMGPFVQ